MLRSFAVAFFALALTTPGGRSFGAGFSLFIDPRFGSTEHTGSTAQVEFDFGEQGGEDRLTLTITNTTPLAIQSHLTAVGFEIPRTVLDPSVIDLLASPGYFDVLTYDQTISPPWIDAPDGYDLVLTGDGSILGGDPQGAPRAGETTTVILTLGDTGLSPEDLADSFQQFYLQADDRFLIGRFQVVGRVDDSDKVGGGVPEPAALLLLMIGGAAVVANRRRS